ncbi:hypothetical protein BDQ17DRAFT_1341572 [Cyathus striatus]|nr:hypothetical protein BDQ17DRAFT_1341572 [Cyathus striatus]
MHNPSRCLCSSLPPVFLVSIFCPCVLPLHPARAEHFTHPVSFHPGADVSSLTNFLYHLSRYCPHRTPSSFHRFPIPQPHRCIPDCVPVCTVYLQSDTCP